MLTVVVHEKGGRTQRLNFEGDQFAIGREEDNDLVLDRVNVSKHHLRLRRREGEVQVLDLESTNGTYLNGRKLTEPSSVRRSDRIYVGDYIVMLEGDDEAIAPREQRELEGSNGTSTRVSVSVPPPRLDPGEPLPPPPFQDDEGNLVTSAERVAAPGTQSTYLDKLVDRIVQTVLANVDGLDPTRAPEVSAEDRETATDLVARLVEEMESDGELKEGVDLDALKLQCSRELLELGPLTELMKEEDVRQIHAVGHGRLRVVRANGGVQLTERRFSGSRALQLAIQRMARKWGFLVEGSQALEGKVGEGFYMYALLPPSQVRDPVLSLRRNATDAMSLEALVSEGVLSADMRSLLTAAIHGCCRILVSASGGTNLDRFMRAIVGEIPESFHVACVSDTGTLGAGRGGWIQVRRINDPQDTLEFSDAMGVIMRGGLDMLVSQRCRHEDAAAAMDAMAGATRGAIVSVWGIDSAHALWRLAGLSTVASGAIASLTVSLARSVDLLVRLGVGVSGEPMQVVEIIEPRVQSGKEIVHVPVFRAVKGPDGSTEFKPTKSVPQCVAKLAEAGFPVPEHVFQQ